eukprot:1978010-Amphidinium_carterae.1
MAVRPLLTIAIVKNYSLHHKCGISIPPYANRGRSGSTTTQEVLPQSAKRTLVNEEGFVRLEDIAKTMAGAS